MTSEYLDDEEVAEGEAYIEDLESQRDKLIGQNKILMESLGYLNDLAGKLTTDQIKQLITKTLKSVSQ